MNDTSHGAGGFFGRRLRSLQVLLGWHQKVYKYMRIYLWTTLSIGDLRMWDLRRRDLAAEIRLVHGGLATTASLWAGSIHIASEEFLDADCADFFWPRRK